eukprot:jgi/Bigna1/81470/fgenesh1_pg.80_\
MGALCRPQDGGDALPDVNREDSDSNEKQHKLEKKITLKTTPTTAMSTAPTTSPDSIAPNSTKGTKGGGDTNGGLEGTDFGFGSEGLENLPDTEETEQGASVGFGAEDLDAMGDDDDDGKIGGEKIGIDSKKSTSSSGPKLLTLEDMKKMKMSAPAAMRWWQT